MTRVSVPGIQTGNMGLQSRSYDPDNSELSNIRSRSVIGQLGVLKSTVPWFFGELRVVQHTTAT